MHLHFFKYQGTGNDFVMVNNLAAELRNPKIIAFLCNRRLGIGADGLISIAPTPNQATHFEMLYYNADGNQVAMCGNGGRCAMAFALHQHIIAKPESLFKASDGLHHGCIVEQTDEKTTVVRLQMKPVEGIEQLADNMYYLNTGVPHVVCLVSDVDSTDVFAQGRAIRYDSRFAEGTNVNFVQPLPSGGLKVRTYERGVEDETLSCGTGVTASVLVAAHLNHTTKGQTAVQTRGGVLSVAFAQAQQGFDDIWLQGETKRVFEGDLYI